MQEHFELMKEEHLRIVLRSGRVLLVTQYVLGAIAGVTISQLDRSVVGALAGALLATAAAAYVVWLFVRTKGIMHAPRE